MKTILLFSSLLIFTTIIYAQNTFLEAKTQFDKDKYKNALSLINKDIAKRGLLEENAILKSRILLYIDADQCFESIQQAINTFPNSAGAYKNRADFYYELKDYRNSILDETKVIELATDDSSKFWGYMGRSTCYDYLNFHDKAISDMKEALIIKPNDINALNNLSMALFSNGQTDESQKILLQILTLDSTLIGTYINLGYQNQQLGRYAEAEKYLTNGLRVNPNEAFLLNNLGYVQHKLGKTSEGIKNINKSIKVNPYNSYCYRNLALIYIDLNEKNKACENIKKAIGLGFSKQYGTELDELSNKHCL
jgi:Tfp pilus assembly protein PilF